MFNSSPDCTTGQSKGRYPAHTASIPVVVIGYDTNFDDTLWLEQFKLISKCSNWKIHRATVCIFGGYYRLNETTRSIVYISILTEKTLPLACFKNSRN